MRGLGLTFIGLLMILPLRSSDKYYVFEQISSSEGFAFDGISTIVEDQYGFLWFGGASGLYYYNTKNFIKHAYDRDDDGTPPADRILKLYKDGFERIWAGTENGLCYFNEQTNAFVRVNLRSSNNNLSAESVTFITQYQDIYYFVVINQQLYLYEFGKETVSKVNLGNINEDITFLSREADDKIYFGTASGNVYVNTNSGDRFRLIYSSSSGPVRTLSTIDDQIWIAFENNGIEVIDQNARFLYRYHDSSNEAFRLPHNSVRKIIQRQNGEIWLGTYKGLVILDGSDNEVISHDPYNGLPHNSIWELYQGRNDGIWIGTWSGGLAYYSDYYYKFLHIRLIKDNVPISNGVISSFSEDNRGNILLGSETNGLFTFDPDRNVLNYLKNGNRGNPGQYIKSIAADNSGGHWFGGYQEGLWYFDGYQMKLVTDEIRDYIISNLLYVDEGLWIGTRENGLMFYNPDNGSIEKFTAEPDNIASISSNRIWDVFQDSRGDIWICSDFGLTVKYKNESRFTRYFNNVNPNSLGQNFNYSIAEDKLGKLWIGSAGSGISIFDPENKSFSEFRLNEEIKDADIYSIIADMQGNMWFTSNQGVYVYYTNISKLKKFSNTPNLSRTRFQPNSGFLHSSGKIFFGGANGFIVIDPKDVVENKIEPEVYLTALLINNSPIKEYDLKYQGLSFMPGINNLELSHDMNFLSFEFASNSFIKAKDNRFRYRLVNYYDEWIESTHGNFVSFTKIPSGNYILQILASNNDGLWTDEPKEIYIKIHPPLWFTWYAYVTYVVVLLILILLYVRNRQTIISERYKHAADEFLFAEKVKFFTNISHEFRTPLNLIISPLDNLMNKLKNQPDLLGHLKMIKRNSERLLRLTNQILDFRLIELNKVKLKPQKTEIISVCNNVYDCFEFMITEKQINCIFTSQFKSFFLSVDAEKIDKVLYNILSNALRYSNEKGQVIVSVEQKTLTKNSYDGIFSVGEEFVGESLEIKVKDNGKGIDPDILPNIFNRFFIESDSEKTGTGIGLHICHEYIQLHQGNIMVTSRKGWGTTFNINIPINNSSEFDKEPMIIQYHFDKLVDTEEDVIDPLSSNKLILFAEDNDEHRMFFKNTLASRYKVLTAKNGKQAFEIAREVIPDLIISDAMMPGMGGFELIELIRESENTMHIPIIILTALSDENSKVDYIQKGADDFITKPVREDYIFAKIERLLKKIDSLKQTYEVQNNGLQLKGVSSDSFIEKAELIVLNNLQNTSLEIGNLAGMLNMSRSSFHRKLKNAVNLSPSEFVRDIRLRKAVELIKKGNLNMDEIGFIVGFNSQSYFIRSFKLKYGKTPTAFKAELSKEDH